MNNLVHILFLMIFTIACQVKNASQDGELISDHRPTTNTFTLQTPTSAVYFTGNTINFNVSFPYDMTITGGTPVLNITVGASPRVANYVSGDGGKILSFSYTVIAADNDTDGVTVNSLGLNGSTMTFDLNGVLTNCNVATVANTTFAGVVVDNTGPVTTGMTITNVPRFYHVGETINFNVTFNENVYVTGTPRIRMIITVPGVGTPQYATYVSGSGSSTLTFNLPITTATADTNGIDSITSPIELNGGTVKDISGNDATMPITSYTANAISYSNLYTKFDGRVPYVNTVTIPANGTYVTAQNLDISLEFNRPVSFSGSPYIEIDMGGTPRQASLITSTSPATTLVFRYTTVPGDSAPTGIVITPSITQNGGTIAGSAAPTNSYFSATGNNAFVVASTTGVIVESIQPRPISVTRNIDSSLPVWGGATPDNTWIIGQQLLITVGFNTNMYVNQTSGTPRIPLTSLNATTRYANYLSGGNGQTTLVFTYTIVENDLDNGVDALIALGDIDLNGGTITDSLNTNSLLSFPAPSSLTNTKVDGEKPRITNVAGPNAGTYSTLTGNNHSNMRFTVTWNEPVQYSSTSSNFPLTIGLVPNNINATYTSGSQSATIYYNPTVLTGLNDSDGITSAGPFAGSAVIRDQVGNTAIAQNPTMPLTPLVLVDTTGPTVSSVTPPASKSYIAGEDLEFLVYFSEPVTLSSTGGSIGIPLTIGASPFTLVSSDGGPSVTHTFRYTVAANLSDTDGVAIANAISVVNPAYIRDAGQNLLTGTYALPDNSGVLVDSTAPTITTVSPPSAGTYTSGDTISFTVNFSESVNVVGTPRIETTAQTGNIYFTYSGGTGTSALTFSYTVGSSDFDLDGLVDVSSINLFGGSTIRDSVNNDLASTSFTTQDLSGIFFIYSNASLWADNTLVNKFTASGVTSSSGGAATFEACGTSTCRTFDGNDSMSMSALNNVKYVYVVLRAPSGVSSVDIITPDIAFYFNFTNMGVYINGGGDLNRNGATSSGTYIAAGVATNSFNIMEIVYSGTQNYSGTVIPTGYSGAIGEVIMATGSLSATQRGHILTYLNQKF